MKLLTWADIPLPVLRTVAEILARKYPPVELLSSAPLRDPVDTAFRAGAASVCIDLQSAIRRLTENASPNE